jgi:hypothetical protein
MEKSVLGRFRVFLSSSGGRIFTPNGLTLHYKQSELQAACRLAITRGLLTQGL